jgi:hypothetical protein
MQQSFEDMARINGIIAVADGIILCNPQQILESGVNAFFIHNLLVG